jgi:signal transduction histidine kinase
VFKYQSGRVIAFGRVMLASLFLLSIWLDQSQPAKAPAQTYGVLLAYVLFALATAAATWRNWWLDARLAAPTHFVDMAVFTAIVFSTNGYTSPFFLFFVLPLLSAAIRWGWRETALTATALILLYLAAGLLVAGTEAFELQRFMIRSGHLVILSALLIWFGIHQRFSRLAFRSDEADTGFAKDEPMAPALALAMGAAEASSGALLVRSAKGETFVGASMSQAGALSARSDRPLVRDPSLSALLFDAVKNRSLTTVADRHFRFAPASEMLDLAEMRRLGIDRGLVAEVHSSTQRGWLVLGGIPDLSTDYIDLGRELGRAVGSLLDRHELLSVIEVSAAAATRLSLARDVHDSIVQFLAGTTFRVEAIMRASKSGAQIESDLKELKRLLIEEQGEIRGFIAALRRNREVELAEAVEELRSLAARLSQQWSVNCRVEGSQHNASIPVRLQLDLQQLLREAVANAVRHGGASRIDVSLTVEGDQLRFNVRDNGGGFAAANDGPPIQPWSLKERVERANGSLFLVSERGRTDLSISLPLARALA